MWPAGEHEAQERLRRFADQRIGGYGTQELSSRRRNIVPKRRFLQRDPEY